MTNSFIVYELDTWSRDLNYNFTLKDCLFEGVKLAKSVNTDKYVFTGYGVGCDSPSDFSLLTVTWLNVSLFLELLWIHLCILIKYMF